MSLPFENELLREQARQQRQREGGQHTDLSDRISLSPLSPIGVGTPNFDIEALLATIPSPEPLVVSPAGQGTNTLDYNKREDVVKAVSTVAFLPAGKNREALIRQFNITQTGSASRPRLSQCDADTAGTNPRQCVSHHHLAAGEPTASTPFTSSTRPPSGCDHRHHDSTHRHHTSTNGHVHSFYHATRDA